jgi:glycosyltransferase involved in cell wall biosynthesis
MYPRIQPGKSIFGLDKVKSYAAIKLADGEGMKVLLSAYACEPNRGSEPELGWQRALQMPAFADEVWVLTRANGRKFIEAEPLSKTPGLHFIYYDLPGWATRLKRQAWFLPFYFILWQWGAYREALKHHREKKFNYVYHVTLSGMLAGSLMGKLGIPFIIGPIAGGERAPFRLRQSLPLRSRLKELVRDLGIVIQRYSPMTTSALGSAERIFVSTPDSLRLVQQRWHSKTEVQISIAVHVESGQAIERKLPTSPRYVFFGRLIYWKGVHLAIRALAETRRTLPDATLTLFTGGSDEKWLRDVARKAGVADAVEFAGFVPSRKKLLESLHTYTALVFPSLHDSGGMVVLEALAEGLPVICLDLGGPGIVVNDSCGAVVSTKDASEAEVVTGLAEAMVSLGTLGEEEQRRLANGSVARAKTMSWTSLTARIAGGKNRVTA